MTFNRHTSQPFEKLPHWFSANQTSENPHFTDDPEQVYLWSIQALDDKEMQAASLHLSRCQYCQTEIADMVQCGSLPLEVQEPRVVVTPLIRNKIPHFGLYFYRTLIAVSAVGILGIVFGLPFMSSSDSGTSGTIAFNPPSVEPTPVASDHDWLIRDTGVNSTVKGVQDETEEIRVPDTDSTDRVFHVVSDSEQNTVGYRVAYGQYLFRKGQTAAAKNQFEKASLLDANHLEVLLGFGLIAYSEKDYARALHLFEEAGTRQDITPLLQFILEYNAAASAAKLEKWDVAKTHWENARHLLNMPELSGDFEIQALSEEIDNELALF